MEHLSIVLISLFCIFFLLGPLAGAINSRRRKESNASEPDPKQLERARRKLSTVTACSLPQPCKAADDIEATAAQLELGECPICIGPLVPEPAHIDGRSIREALEELTTRSAGRRTRQAARRISSSLSETWSKQLLGKKRSHRESCSEDVTGETEVQEEPAAPVLSDDDVLTLNSCGHAFHSRCLASWFLMERYDCPICRVVYYEAPASAAPAATVPTRRDALDTNVRFGFLMERSQRVWGF